MKLKQNIKENYVHAGRRFVTKSILLLFAILAVRVYEMGLMFGSSSGIFKYEFSGILHDLYLFIKIDSLLLIPFILLFLIKEKIANFFFLLSTIIITIINIGLVHYFKSTNILLGSDIFGYSWEEIELTVKASGELNILTLIPFIIFIAGIIFLFYRVKRIKLSKKVVLGFYIVLAVSLFIPGGTDGTKIRNFDNEFHSYLFSNKIGYFAGSSFDNLEKAQEDANRNTKLRRKSLFSDKYGFEYVSRSYPFLHVEKTEDVLGSYFETTNSTKPNFVFIIVESLGAAYSGNNAYLRSFTPFMDSLARHGLYFNNFISTTGRTYGVLPSMFGSLPFCSNGFTDLGFEMPHHLTSISLLKEQGYYSSFIYGGESGFDNMDIFMNYQNVDTIVDVNSFGNDYKKLPGNENDFSWGYGDKEIFRKYIELIDTISKPRIDVILTLAIHSPFKVHNQEYYNSKVESRFNELNIPLNEIDNYRVNIDKYASIMYYDDALSQLIEQYSNREDFKNTIFVVTGDHRMPEIPISSQMDRFHVPFLIYSPMIKEPKTISSLSSHFDVTPSLLSFLRENYEMEFPKVSHWLGNGLDTNTTYRNTNSYPLMRNKNELEVFLNGDFLYVDGSVFEIFPDLGIGVIEQPEKAKELEKKLSDFKADNYYICNSKKLMPDSLKIKNWK